MPGRMDPQQENSMDNRAIGIFDSGLGGLTAVKALRELLPEENIIYFADSGRAPYGARPAEQLRRMAVQDMDFVARRGAKAIIAACGTVSSTAPDLLEACPLPVVGVLQAGTEALARAPGAVLGLIATQASIDSGAFQRAMARLCPGREVIALACPEFVPLIESGHSSPEDPLLKAAVERSLAPLKAAGVSALLLGCTHYGIIGRAISDYLGEETLLVSAAAQAARRMRDYLTENGLTGGRGQTEYYTSGRSEDFSALAGAFLGRELESRPIQVRTMEA